MLQLVNPSFERLAGLEMALAAGWSPDTTRDVSALQLAALREDRLAFLAHLARQDGSFILPDGTEVPRLPSREFWIWDGDFAGRIGLRYAPGTEALPHHVSGHIGYAVVPWKQRRGYATEALRMILPVARDIGLTRVVVTCDEGNLASRKVIEANGGEFIGNEPSPYGDGIRKLVFRLSTVG